MDLSELVNSCGTEMEWHRSVLLTRPIVSSAAFYPGEPQSTSPRIVHSCSY